MFIKKKFIFQNYLIWNFENPNFIFENSIIPSLSPSLLPINKAQTKADYQSKPGYKPPSINIQKVNPIKNFRGLAGRAGVARRSVQLKYSGCLCWKRKGGSPYILTGRLASGGGYS